MPSGTKRLVLVLPWFTFCFLAVLLTTASKPACAADEKADSAKDNLSVTEQSIHMPGGVLQYKATAGTLTLKDEEGKALASIFFVAYTKTSAEDPAKRPITFAFNGGP